MLLKNLGLKEKHKLQASWSPFCYTVVGKLPKLPVYKVKPEKGSGGVKSVHQDHILPNGQLVRLPKTDCNPPTRSKTRISATQRWTENSPWGQDIQDSYSSSELSIIKLIDLLINAQKPWSNKSGYQLGSHLLY